MTTKKKLCAVKGISEAKMEKIKEASNKLCVSLQFFPRMVHKYTKCSLIFKLTRVKS